MTTPLHARLRAALRRIAGLFGRTRAERELAAELESHLQLHVDDNLRAGMTPAEARRAALLRLGGLEATRLAYRDRASLPWLEHLGQDLRFAWRQLRQSPGFATAAVVVLTLGLGASATVFSVVDAALLAPLPYPRPDRLVRVAERTAQFPRSQLSYEDYRDWAAQTTTLASLEVYTGTGHMLRGTEGSQAVRGTRVSAGFFRTLGSVPAIGRDFLVGEDGPAAAPVVILSHGMWQSRFGGRPDVLGQSLTLSDVPHVIVGILPASFRFAPAGATELWTPLQPRGCELRRSCHNLEGLGRLRDGVSAGASLADMATIAQGLERRYPDSNRGQGAFVAPLAEVLAGRVRPVLLVLLGGAGLLLVIAGVNVASLLLLRAERRRRELAVRRALGATRARLVRQFVTEGGLLMLLGATLGLIGAHGMLGFAAPLVPPDMRASMPYLDTLGVTLRSVGVTALVALCGTALFTLAPVLRLPASDAHVGMADGHRSTGTAWQRLGFTLVAVELAMAVVLLVGAGLLGKSLYQVLRVDLGFTPAGLAAIDVAVPESRFGKPEDLVALSRRIEGRVSTLPGVIAVGLTSVKPVSFNGNTDWIRFVGRPWDGRHTEVNMRDVSAGYFATLNARLLRGRPLADTDTAAVPKVVVINQALARQHFPNQDPLGLQFGDTALTPASIKTIVGIVDDIREGPLDAEVWPAVYYPFAQDPDSSFSIVVRTSQAEGAILPTLRAALTALDPDIGMIRETTMSESIGQSPTAYLHQLSAWLVGGFAGIAWLLGVVGLYGVMAYRSVSGRANWPCGSRWARSGGRSIEWCSQMPAGWRAPGSAAGSASRWGSRRSSGDCCSTRRRGTWRRSSRSPSRSACRRSWRAWCRPAARPR